MSLKQTTKSKMSLKKTKQNVFKEDNQEHSVPPPQKKHPEQNIFLTSVKKKCSPPLDARTLPS